MIAILARVCETAIEQTFEYFQIDAIVSINTVDARVECRTEICADEQRETFSDVAMPIWGLILCYSSNYVKYIVTVI